MAGMRFQVIPGVYLDTADNLDSSDKFLLDMATSYHHMFDGNIILNLCNVFFNKNVALVLLLYSALDVQYVPRI